MNRNQIPHGDPGGQRGSRLRRLGLLAKKPPQLSYLICSVPRSGSYLLAEALRDTGVAGRPEEYFDQGFAWFWRERLNAANDQELFRKIIVEGMTKNGIFGAKVHWYQFQHLGETLQRLLPAKTSVDSTLLPDVLPNLRYLWLRRDDKIRAAISYSKAIQSGVWWKVAGYECEPKARPVFNYDAINLLISQLEDFETAWKHYFEEAGIKPFIILYESLIRRYDRTVLDILHYLGIKPSPGFHIAKPRLKKQADLESEEWVRIYQDRSRKASRGNDSVPGPIQGS